LGANGYPVSNLLLVLSFLLHPSHPMCVGRQEKTPRRRRGRRCRRERLSTAKQTPTRKGTRRPVATCPIRRCSASCRSARS
jgi:hypothetical protein